MSQISSITKLLRDVNLDLRGDSIITSRPAGRWVYTLFVILRDGKLGWWVVLD